MLGLRFENRRVIQNNKFEPQVLKNVATITCCLYLHGKNYKNVYLRHFILEN